MRRSKIFCNQTKKEEVKTFKATLGKKRKECYNQKKRDLAEKETKFIVTPTNKLCPLFISLHQIENPKILFFVFRLTFW